MGKRPIFWGSQRAPLKIQFLNMSPLISSHFGVSWYPHFFYFNLFEPKILAQDEGDEDDGTLDISVAGPTFRLQDDGSW